MVAQTSDSTPPQLVSLPFSPKAVDVSRGAKTVMVDATITDNLSGFWSGSVGFTSPRGQYAWPSLSRLTGDSLSGTYRGVATLPIHAEAGVWTVSVGLSYGKWSGQAGFNLAADINNDRIVDIRDPFIVTRRLRPGTTCQ